jgi:threonine dehydrogenase-like Zn-dependent dehydrogenase
VRTVVGIRGRDGAFAEYLSLPSINLHEIPPLLDDITAVFVEPTAAACRVVEQVRIDPGTCAAVVGAGRLGLLVAQVLREQGARLTVVVRGERGRSIAAAFGFETAMVEAAETSLARRFDVVVDASGAAAGFAVASALVRPRGTLVVKSTFHGETPVSLSSIVVDEIAVIGSRCGPFARAIELLGSGRVAVKPLVAGIYPLDQFAEAFDHAKRGSKAILVPHLNEKATATNG